MKKKNNIQRIQHLILGLIMLFMNSCTKDETPAPAVIVIPEYYSSIAAGGDHSLALEPDGTLWAWGWNIYGQLGDGTFKNRITPVQIGHDYSAIAAGYFHSLALKKDSTLWTW